jgi:hypothetical protein
MNKLAASKKRIRYEAVRLSSLIDNPYISELVKKLEQYDGS